MSLTDVGRSGGLLEVQSGQSVQGVTVSSGGTLELFGGATATGTSFAVGSILKILSGTWSGLATSDGETLAIGAGARANNTTSVPRGHANKCCGRRRSDKLSQGGPYRSEASAHLHAAEGQGSIESPCVMSCRLAKRPHAGRFIAPAMTIFWISDVPSYIRNERI
jgi:autotransporter passenger strand-loop-strand repeat protein